VELVEQHLQVRGERVVVVAGRWPARVAEAAAVVGDDTMAGVEQHGELFVPGTAAQRVAVNQDDRLSRPVVLVMQLDVARVLLSDLDVRHPASFRSGGRASSAAANTSATRALTSPATDSST